MIYILSLCRFIFSFSFVVNQFIRSGKYLSVNVFKGYYDRKMVSISCGSSAFRLGYLYPTFWFHANTARWRDWRRLTHTAINPVSFASSRLLNTHCFQLSSNVPGGPWEPLRLPLLWLLVDPPVQWIRELRGDPVPWFLVGRAVPEPLLDLRVQGFRGYLGFLVRKSKHWHPDKHKVHVRKLF